MFTQLYISDDLPSILISSFIVHSVINLSQRFAFKIFLLFFCLIDIALSSYNNHNYAYKIVHIYDRNTILLMKSSVAPKNIEMSFVYASRLEKHETHLLIVDLGIII